MRKLILLLVLLFILVAVPFSFAQDVTNTVRAVWDQNVLVLINISSDGVDVSELSLQGESGGIFPENWVLAVDPATTLPYTLTNVRPGSCLVAYRSGSTATPPAAVSCTRIIGEFEVTNLADVIWTSDHTDFTPVLAGAEGEACDTRNRTACDIAVNPFNPNPPAEAEAPTEVVIKALWNNDILVLLNTSNYGVDLTDLSLSSLNTDGAITPDLWVMAVDPATTREYSLGDVRPGSCLLAYLGTEGADTAAPPLPENVACTQIIGAFTAENPIDLVWQQEAGGFTPVLDGTGGDVCEYGTTTDCDITVPVADEDSADDTVGGKTEAPIRLVWNNDILVVINISSEGVDLSNLTLQAVNGGGAITPDLWTLNVNPATGESYSLADVRPGSCLLAYLGTEGATTAAPELPENLVCTRVVGVFTAVNPADIVWSIDAGGFTPVVSGAAGDACDIVNATTCDVDLD